MIDFEAKNNLTTFGLEILSSNNANFDSELIRHIGDYDGVLPLIDAAKPLVGFIKNNSSKEVVGISLRWEFFKSDSEEIFSTSDGVSSPGVLMGMKPRDPWMVGKTSLINSNESRFFSYFGHVSQMIENVNKRVKYQRIKYDPTAEDIQSRISSIEYQKNSTVLRDVAKAVVSFDGIFFNDGVFVGSNRDFFFELINGSIQGKRDCLRKLRAARASGKSDSEITTQFVEEISEMMRQIPEFAPTHPGIKFTNGPEAFNQGYKSQLKSIEETVIRRKTKFSDTVIINDYLEVEDEGFIDVRREN